MNDRENVRGESGGKFADFVLDFSEHRWTSAHEPEMPDFPFIAEVRGRRYELYGDGTFDEEELTPEEEQAVGP